jgi:hypothetical protein
MPVADIIIRIALAALVLGVIGGLLFERSAGNRCQADYEKVRDLLREAAKRSEGKDVTSAQISEALGRRPNLREESPQIRETYAYKGLFRTYVFRVVFLKIGPVEHAEECILEGAL